ncbi:MAG: hypothetical protein KAS72_06650 [Phycisphaerales bacterium]|nr:hypothetical protein [Phycisphaerales bacterium]
MLDLVDILDLAEPLEQAGFASIGQDFEHVYATVAASHEHSSLCHLLEERVAEYFRGLQLPDAPTIYDHLVLSLRPKDAIATFNWDPFLWQACQRHHAFAPLPKILFLHGCAIVGWCEADKKQGLVGQRCRECGELYRPTRLLYPVANKDYTSDPYISSQWRSIRAGLGSAFLLTFFGYGAPDSDAAAVDLMSAAWGTPDARVMEEIEIIDIKTEDQLVTTWTRFIHSHHYTIAHEYSQSILANYPRRSVEAYWQSLIEARFREENPVPQLDSIDALHEWFAPLIDRECAADGH